MIELVVGYTVPLAVVLITFLVEMLADECDPIRPKFGQQQCFFSSHVLGIALFTLAHRTWTEFCLIDRLPKFVWFYLPILLMLILNCVAFGFTIAAFMRVEKNKRRLNIRDDKERSEKSDK